MTVGVAPSIAVATARPAEERDAAALDRCGPLFGRAVLVVSSGRHGEWSVLRRAKEEGAMVTALCAPERAQDAREAGADAVMDPARQDPTWYRGAWAVVYDPAGLIGFRRAASSLGPGGFYVTSSARLPDRARAMLAGLSGGPRLLLVGMTRSAFLA
jgi:NADPH:quinone reductase-like Zn-dependent oxidoreductase